MSSDKIQIPVWQIKAFKSISAIVLTWCGWASFTLVKVDTRLEDVSRRMYTIEDKLLTGTTHDNAITSIQIEGVRGSQEKPQSKTDSDVSE